MTWNFVIQVNISMDMISLHLIKNFSSKNFQEYFIGVPWWDHALPIQLINYGFNNKSINVFIYHLRHDGNRWSENLFYSFGLARLRNVFFCRDFAGLPVKLSVLKIINGMLFSAKLKLVFWHAKKLPVALFIHRILMHVAYLNISKIESWGFGGHKI